MKIVIDPLDRSHFYVLVDRNLNGFRILIRMGGRKKTVYHD